MALRNRPVFSQTLPSRLYATAEFGLVLEDPQRELFHQRILAHLEGVARAHEDLGGGHGFHGYILEGRALTSGLNWLCCRGSELS